jgi:16S rRNA (uracil1498-N3)-methyltransferase
MGGPRPSVRAVIRILAEIVQDAGSRMEIRGDERHYVVDVRRVKVGDAVEIVGTADGRRATAAIREVRGDVVVAEVTEVLDAACAVREVHILAAVPKRDLMDDVVRKLSELGVARLTPVVAERSIVAPGEAKLARWRRLAGEAVRQCGRGTPLRIDPLTPFAEALRDADAVARLILDPRAPRSRFAAACVAAKSIAVAIGPEGGFTAEELELAAALGFFPVGLGRTTLRIETAAIAAAVLAVDALGG